MVSDDRLRIVGDGTDADHEVLRAHLSPFTGSAQRYLDAELARRQTRPVPVLRLPARRRWVAVAIGGVAAVAAAAAIIVSAIAPRDSAELGDDPKEQASRSEGERLNGGTAVPRQPATAKPEAAAADEQTLQSLDAEAQRQWRAGDLDGARRTFERMTERGGDHRYVELAFADLVTLARQQSKPARVKSLWREYLERFPRGRFAADARGAVCGGPQAPAACNGGSRGASTDGLGQDSHP